MTDRELLGYAEFHSQTPRALFSPEHCEQLTKIIYGDEVAKKNRPYEWRALYYENIKDELAQGWKNLRAKEKRLTSKPD